MDLRHGPRQEVQLLKRRISSPRAATVVASAAVVALAVTVTPSLAKKAESFLTAKKAAATYVTNKKAATLYVKKKAASNLYVAKATAPKPPVVGIAAGTAPFAISATTAGYIPTAFTSFATRPRQARPWSRFPATSAARRRNRPRPWPARSRSSSTASPRGKSTSPPRLPPRRPRLSFPRR